MIFIQKIVTLLVVVHRCMSILDCRSEKAINHMKNIMNVESYVYNDADVHLLNINNKGIKDIKPEIFSYYATRHGSRNEIEFIYLMYNNIHSIEAASFAEFPNVRNINFGVNLLEVVKRNFFDGIEKLEFLNFQSNLIQTIDEGAFDDLQFLEYLYLDDNCLTQIPPRLFVYTPRIRNIFLQQNRLISISDNFLRPNQKLFGLNLADNRLHDISNLFNFKGLTSLIASNNKLNPIRPDWISDENEMVMLNIDNTTLSNVNFVGKLKKLKELYASHNRIRIFDAKLLRGAKELTHISLQSNPLEKLLFNDEVNEVLSTTTTTALSIDISGSQIESNCFYLLEVYNLANEKFVNLNINLAALNACLKN